MTNMFRALILVALTATAIAAAMPFDRALVINLPLHGTTPNIVLPMTFLGIVGTTLMIASALGLLAFQRWARPLATWSTLAFGLLAAVALTYSPLLGAISYGAALWFLLAAVCWVCALTLMGKPSLSGRR